MPQVPQRFIGADPAQGGAGNSGSGGSGSGGSSGGGSGATVVPTAPSQQQRPGPSQWSFALVLAATDVPQLVPGFTVPTGQTIWLYAKNGSAAGNAKPIFIADRPAALQGLPNARALCLMPADVVPYPAPSTGRIWVSGTEGDGVTIQVATTPNAS